MSDSDHPNEPNCTGCGRALPEDAPEGACPHCLLEAALDDGDDAVGTDDATNVEPDSPGPPPAPTPEEMTARFPDLEVLELLGQGGMGIVYKARQTRLDRIVALKVLPERISSDPAFAERFTREARAMAKLTHPHIVGVHEFGEQDGLCYLLMEFIDGANLRQMMRDGHLEASQALAIVPQICEALQFAHDRGVVHRDIKPENILVDRGGNVKIADFGLAKMAQRTPVDISITGTGQVMGTLHYMAPEQYRTPQDVDHRADLYSLGVVFYEMLTGDLPLGVFSPPSKLSAVDARVDQVVLRALERERERRWQHASDIKTEVDSVAHAAPDEVPPVIASPPTPAPADGASDTTPPPPPVPEAPSGPRRLSRLAIAGFVLPLLAVIAPIVVVAAFIQAAQGDTPQTIRELAGGWMLAVAASGAALLVGFVLSIVAWVRIERSDGRLKGLPLAILGTLLTPVLICCGGGVTTFALFGASVRELPDEFPVPDGPIRIETGTLPEPGIPVNVRPAHFPVNAAEVQTQILNKMSALRAIRRTDATKVFYDDLRQLYGPFDRDEIDGMDPARLDTLGGSGGLGLPLLDPAHLPAPLDAMQVVAIDVDAMEDRATVTLEGGDRRVKFAMVEQFSDWWFATDAVDLVAGSITDTDTAADGDPAPAEVATETGAIEVTGGRSWMTDDDRAEAGRGVVALWTRFTRSIESDGLEPTVHRSYDWYTSAERSRFNMVDADLFERLRAARLLGLPYVRPETGTIPFENTAVSAVRLAPDGSGARVRVERQGTGWDFSAVQVGGTWFFGIGPVVAFQEAVTQPIGQPLPIEVHDGPLDDVDRWTEVSEIVLLWGRARRAANEGGLADGAGRLDVDAARWYVPPSVRDEFTASDPDDEGLELGLVAVLPRLVERLETGLDIAAIRFDEPATGAVVVARMADGARVRFPVVREDGLWWLALGSVDVEE